MVQLETTDQARNLDVIMDSDMNLQSHIKEISTLAFYHVGNIFGIKGLMIQGDLEKLIHLLFNFHNLNTVAKFFN